MQSFKASHQPTHTTNDASRTRPRYGREQITRVDVLLTVLIAALFFSTTSVAQSGYKAKYKLSIGGLTVAKMKRYFEVDSTGRYEFVSKIKASGLVGMMRSDQLEETSRGTLVEGQFRPDVYTYERTNKRKPRSVHTEFDYTNGGSIRTIYNGEPRLQALPGGILDKLIYQAALADDLAAGKPILRYVVADRGKERIYEPAISNDEITKTPFGEFTTIKVVRNTPGDKRSTTFWCAPSLNYLPIKVTHTDKGGSETVIVMTHFEPLP